MTYRQADAFYRAEYLHEAKFINGKKLSGFRQDIRSVHRYLDRALEYFGDMYVDAISYRDLQRYKDMVANLPVRNGKKRSVSDINHHLKRVRRLLNVAIEQGWIETNPFSRGSSLIVESFEVERTRIVSPEEETRLLAQCDKWRKHLKAVVIFAIETGMRRGEIQMVRWADIDFDRRLLRVASFNTKTLKARLIPLSRRVIEVLEELQKASKYSRTSLVFGNADFKRGFNTACSRAKLADLHFHDLRHTAITRMLEKGISPPLVMKISGHTQQRTFLRYVNQSESSILDIARKLDRAA